MVGLRRKRREHLRRRRRQEESDFVSFLSTLGLFELAEEEGNDTNVSLQTRLTSESGVTCGVVNGEERDREGIERDEDGDFVSRNVRRKRVESGEVRNGWNRGFSGVRDV